MVASSVQQYLVMVGIVLLTMVTTFTEQRMIAAETERNDVLLSALRLMGGDEANRVKVMVTRSLDVAATENDEPRQFCGETLYYVVEYYCVHVKGTGVYVPSEDELDEDVSKSKRDATSDGLAILFFFSHFYFT